MLVQMAAILVGLLALLLALVAVIMARRAVQRAQQQQQRLEQKIGRLEAELSAMMDGAFGVASCLQEVEMSLKDTARRQEQLQQRDLGRLPYDEAVRLAAKGAGVGELVERCGLSRSEAELVALLHRRSTCAGQ